jgi:hypothetical protein
MKNPITTTIGRIRERVASKLIIIAGAAKINQKIARIMITMKHPQELIGLDLYLLGYPILP